MNQTRLILYSTDHCTLCDQALDMLLSMPELGGLSVRVVDIAAEDELYTRLAERIPVLGDADSGAELGWPFDPTSVLAWLGKTK